MSYDGLAPADKMLVGRSQQFFLEPKMVEQAAFADARPGRNPLEGDRGHPDVANQRQRRVQNPVAGAGSSAPAVGRFRFAHLT